MGRPPTPASLRSVIQVRPSGGVVAQTQYLKAAIDTRLKEVHEGWLLRDLAHAADVTMETLRVLRSGEPTAPATDTAVELVLMWPKGYIAALRRHPEADAAYLRRDALRHLIEGLTADQVDEVWTIANFVLAQKGDGSHPFASGASA